MPKARKENPKQRYLVVVRPLEGLEKRRGVKSGVLRKAAWVEKRRGVKTLGTGLFGDSMFKGVCYTLL